MTPMPCRVAGCIISIGPTFSCAGALTYLLTVVEHKAKVTVNGLYKVVHGLSFAAKMHDLE